MKKIFVIMLSVCVLFSVSACTGDSKETATKEADTKEVVESGTTEDKEFWHGVIYADFSCGSTDEELIKESPFEGQDEKTTEEFVRILSMQTGLDFKVTITEAEDGLIVDWANDSTLIANLDDREQVEGYTFQDADSMRWFMMDSLWRTLTNNFEVENIYYTMDGGKELSFDELSPINVFPSDTPYMGSAFYYAHADVKGDEEGEETEPNTYYDESTGFLLTYPSDFSAMGTLDENGAMNFPTLWDSALLYWTGTNDQELSPAEFEENLDVEESKELEGNVVIARGESEDYSGNMVPTVFYWVVDEDIIVNVRILCTEKGEDNYWYNELQNQAIYIEQAAGTN